MALVTQQGIIALYNIGKKWGFISSLDSPEDSTDKTFFHTSNCVPGYQPTLGDLVEFELGPSYKLGKKSQAIHVRLVQATTVAGFAAVTGFTAGEKGGDKEGV